MSHKYSWTLRGPKHEEVINKIDEIVWELIVQQVGFIYKIFRASLNIYLTIDKILMAIGGWL